jgi:hypothetical protein
MLNEWFLTETIEGITKIIRKFKILNGKEINR